MTWPSQSAICAQYLNLKCCQFYRLANKAIHHPNILISFVYKISPHALHFQSVGEGRGLIYISCVYLMPGVVTHLFCCDSWQSEFPNECFELLLLCILPSLNGTNSVEQCHWGRVTTILSVWCSCCGSLSATLWFSWEFKIIFNAAFQCMVWLAREL